MRWGVGAERVPYHGDAHWARGPHQAAQGRHPRREQAPPPATSPAPRQRTPGAGGRQTAVPQLWRDKVLVTAA